MILTCPKCASRFLLAASALGEDGRNVRCSECGQIWYQDPPEEDEIKKQQSKATDDEFPAFIKSAPGDHSLPAKRKGDAPSKTVGGNVGGIMAAVLFFCSTTALVMFEKQAIIQAMPQTVQAYNIMGVEANLPGYGIVFDKLEAKSAGLHDGKEMINLSGKLINLTRDTQGIPLIRGEFQDEHDKPISYFYIKSPVSSLEPEAQSEFAAQVPNKSNDTKKIMLSLVLSMRQPELMAAGMEGQMVTPEHESAHEVGAENMHNEQDVQENVPDEHSTEAHAEDPSHAASEEIKAYEVHDVTAQPPHSEGAHEENTPSAPTVEEHEEPAQPHH